MKKILILWSIVAALAFTSKGETPLADNTGIKTYDGWTIARVRKALGNEVQVFEGRYFSVHVFNYHGQYLTVNLEKTPLERGNVEGAYIVTELPYTEENTRITKTARYEYDGWTLSHCRRVFGKEISADDQGGDFCFATYVWKTGDKYFIAEFRRYPKTGREVVWKAYLDDTIPDWAPQVP
jgi:hypothetical protein